MSSSGIEPVTLRLVAQCLSQLRYYVHQYSWYKLNLLDVSVKLLTLDIFVRSIIALRTIFHTKCIDAYAI
jgi:hypothetical protein